MVTALRSGVLVVIVSISNFVFAVDVHPPLENAVSRALQKKIAVDFQQRPLVEVLTELAKNAGIPIAYDSEAVKQKKIELNRPITLTLSEQPIAHTLDVVLHPLTLDFESRSDLLRITTQNQIEAVLKQRSFDVSQLIQLIQPRIESVAVYNAPASALDIVRSKLADDGKATVNPADKATQLFSEDPHYRKADFRLPLKTSQPRFAVESVLVKLIQQNTSGIWEEEDGVGGTITISPGRLLIRQTERVHRESFHILSNLETFLRDPQADKRMRIADDADDRERRAALDRILNSPSDSPPSSMPLQKWITENIEQNGVKIWIALPDLKNEDVNWPAATILLSKGVSKRTLFQNALDKASASLVYSFRQFMVTSAVTGDSRLSTIVFDTSDIPEAKDIDWIQRYLGESTSGHWEAIDGIGGTADSNGISGLLFVRQTEKVLEEVAERLNDLRRPLEIPAKPLQPQRSRSIYTLPDVATATDLQAVLPKLVDLPDATWPEDAIQRVGALLIIQQTEFVHRRIETVIDTIRQAHDIKPTDSMP